MSNPKNNNLEDVSKGNDESAPKAADSTSNKKTRFTKSQSISEVFKELESEDYGSDKEISNDLDISSSEDIIPIHNEYEDLDKSEALAKTSVEGAVVINPDSDDLTTNVNESIEYEFDSIENNDSIDSEADSDEFSETLSVGTDSEFSESVDGEEEMDDEDSLTADDSETIMADEMADDKIGKSSAQGVLINNKEETSDSKRSFDIFNSSTIISIVGFIVGLIILLIGITYYASSSDRVVDNVLSGETAGLAIFLVIIGLIIIIFSLLRIFSSSKSSLIIDTFNSIKSIDYDEISEDTVSREDFDAVLGIFKRKKDSDFSDNDSSVDSSKDLFDDEDEKLSDDDISSLYSKSNLTSQKNQTSSKEHENASSTELSQDYGDDYSDGEDEIVPIHSNLNEQSEESSLEDKYSKYEFDDDSDGSYEDYELAEEDYDEVNVDENLESASIDENYANSSIGGDYADSSIGDAYGGDYIEEDYDSQSLDEEVPQGQYSQLKDSEDMGSNQFEEDFENNDSDLEVEKMDGLEDKYAKYDFDDDFDEVEESVSKPKFKKSVDLSKFEKEPLSEEELLEQKRKAQERMLEKKRRIIEGTNFDNSLRKQ